MIKIMNDLFIDKNDIVAVFVLHKDLIVKTSTGRFVIYHQSHQEAKTTLMDVLARLSIKDCALDNYCDEVIDSNFDAQKMLKPLKKDLAKLSKIVTKKMKKSPKTGEASAESKQLLADARALNEFVQRVFVNNKIT